MDRVPTPPRAPEDTLGDPRQDPVAAVWRRHVPADEPESVAGGDTQPRPVVTGGARQRIPGRWVAP